MQRSAFNAQPIDQHEPESVVVHVQLRPRRGATRKCLAALAALATEHPEASFAVTGLSKDDRVVKVTVGVDLGPRTGVAKFSPQAQAAYAFVSAAVRLALRPHAGLHRRAQWRRARRGQGAASSRRPAVRSAPTADVLEAPAAPAVARSRPPGCRDRASGSRPDGFAVTSGPPSPWLVLPRSPRSTGDRYAPLFPTSTATDTRNRVRQPLVFGGLPEADGWTLAPITPRDRVHFRVDHELPLEEFRADLPDGVTVSYDQGDGLYRVDGARGSAPVLADWVRAWCARHGCSTVGLRAETDVRRRAPRDLPADFLNDLCRHYGPVSLKRLQRNMSTIRLHLPDPDDLGQQVYEWVLKAVAQYDETKGVPFGAFLATQLSKWVHDLGRNAHGRTAADTEHKQQKAIAAFIAEHQRRPSEKELAAYMGQTVATLRRNSQTVATLNGLRNLQSLDGGPDATEILLPDSSRGPGRDHGRGGADAALARPDRRLRARPDRPARPAGRSAQRARLGHLVPDDVGRADQDAAVERPQHVGAQHERLRRPGGEGAEDAPRRTRRLTTNDQVT